MTNVNFRISFISNRERVSAARANRLVMLNDLFDVVLSGAVKIEINQTPIPRSAAQVYRALESHKNIGSTVLMV
jgi:NADPH2:quinone reductase